MEDNNKQVSLFKQSEIPITKTLKERRNKAIRTEYTQMTKEKHLNSTYVVS